MKSATAVRAILALGALGTAALATQADAQVPTNFTIVASGLNAPRGLKFGPDGNLYVAEGGTGGTNMTTAAQCEQVNGPVGPYYGGSTGAIVKIIPSTGTTSVVASGFPSTEATSGDLSSVSDVAFLSGQLFALAGGGCSHGNPQAPNGIAQVNTSTGKWNLISDLSAYAMTHPGQYDDAADFEPDGVWSSMISYNNRLVVTEPNRGIVVSVGVDGKALELLDISASQGHIVPTGIAESNGDFYVGNLLYFPIVPDWSRILRVSKVGSIAQDQIPGMQHKGGYYVSDSKAGLTTVMAVTFGPDGLLYALELADASGFPAPGLGKVVRLKRSGDWEDVVTGLNVPGGMTWGPDGALYVSDFSAVPAPGFGAGRILRFSVAFGY